MSNVVRAPRARMPAAVAHFIHEAIFAARDAEDALMRDVTAVRPTEEGVEVEIAGQRLQVTVRACEPGVYAR